MAQSSRPDPAVSSGALTEAEWERVAVRFSDDGVYGDPTDTAHVVAGTGLQVTVRAERRASVRGYDWYSGTVDYTHTITSNSSGQTRVDRVVLRLDRSNWTVRSVVKAGTPGAGAPALQQDTGGTGYYEITLAQVTVGNNASSVTVSREELYVGTRVRPCTSSMRPSPVKRGETAFETDTGKFIGWNGSTWGTLHEHAGPIVLGQGYSAWEHYVSNVAWLHNGLVTVRVGVKRVGSQFGVSDTDGSYLANVPTSLAPSTHNLWVPAVLFSNGALARPEVRTNGQIWVQELTKDVPINTTLAFSFTYGRGVA